jgi:hypothetical protein
MSNYPAGVTGREFAIAGYDSEEEAYRECGKYGVVHVFTDDARREIERIKVLLAEIAEGKKPTSLAATLIVNLNYLVKHRVNGVEVEECPFAGDVTISWYGKQGDWTCPLCSYEHHEDAPEPDEDWGRDR